MSSSRALSGKVCIVTGATRGIGKGVAQQLAKAGATVYITGRTLDPAQDSKVVGCLRDTASKIEVQGNGRCIPVQCDHSKDDDIKELFDRVSREQDGQLDVLVNNAYSAVNALYNHLGTKFWEQPISLWDDINNVGLRNHYICAIYAAKMMVPRKRGLIVNVSSSGGLHYLFNPAYGSGKEACDRMAVDCALELRQSNVAFVSLWPGPVSTELVLDILRTANASGDPATSKQLGMFERSETPDFVGKCIASLVCDSNLMAKSGKIMLTAELGDEYGLKDSEGHTPINVRRVNNLVRIMAPKWSWLAWLIPNFLKIPKCVLAMAGSKF